MTYDRQMTFPTREHRVMLSVRLSATLSATHPLSITPVHKHPTQGLSNYGIASLLQRNDNPNIT